jgi:hypothetical protein
MITLARIEEIDRGIVYYTWLDLAPWRDFKEGRAARHYYTSIVLLF